MNSHIQEHFPNLFTKDRRKIQVDQVVRIRKDWDPRLGGLWMLVKEVDDEFLTGLVLTIGEDPVLLRVPRAQVESIRRVLGLDRSPTGYHQG